MKTRATVPQADHKPKARSSQPFFPRQEGEASTAAFFQAGIQPALILRRAGDPFEREADVVAEAATRDSTVAERGPRVAAGISHVVQRQAEAEREEPVQAAMEEEREEPVQAAMEEEREEPVQAAMEAEREEPVQAAMEEEREEPVQAQAGEKRAVRITAEGAEERLTVGEAHPPERAEGTRARPRAASEREGLAAGTHLAPAFAGRLDLASAGGRPLAPDVRQTMERIFGADLEQVRVHDGTEAARLSRDIGAKAFTYRNHIFFNLGRYDPASREGRRLLAHELAHTVQQGAVRTQAGAPAEGEIAAGGAPFRSQAGAARAAGTAGQPAEIARGPLPGPAGGTVAVASPGTAPGMAGAGVEAAAPGMAEAEAEVAVPGEAGVAVGEAGGAGAAAEEPRRAPTSPAEDPAFQETMGRVNAAKRGQRDHREPEIKLGEVQVAAHLSEDAQKDKNDRQAHLGEISATAEASAQPTEPFTAETFKAALVKNLAEIERNLPDSESEAESFKRDKPLEVVRQSIGGQVKAESGKVAAPIAEEVKQQEPPPSGGRVETPQELVEEPAGKPPRPIEPQAAAPKPRFDSEISMEKESRSLDELMAENNMTEEQLAESNEPSFQQALETKRQAQAEAAAAPGRYRTQEQETLAGAQARAGGAGQRGLGGMFEARQGVFGDVFTRQGSTESVDKTQQDQVYKELECIYNATKKDVGKILEDLSTEVDDIFTREAGAAKEDFEKRVEDKLDDIYGVTVIDDWIFGEDTEAIAEAFSEEKQRFLTRMDETLDDIAELVARKLNEAMARARKGREESDTFFSGLSKDQQTRFQEARDFFSTQYDNLEESVNDKQRELAQTLAESYSANVQSLRESFDKIKDEVRKGWIGKAVEFVVDVATAIAKLAELLYSVLSRLAGLIGDILAHPIRFLENLGAGIASGFGTFVDKIDEYLIAGFFDWLRGSVGGPGLKLPENFDAGGMFSLALQVIGLDYPTFRGVAVRVLGKEVVAGLEKGVEFVTRGVEKGSEFVGKGLELIQIAREEGLGALWEHIKEMLLSNVDEVFAKVKETVLYETIKKVLAFVASLFTPAGAFIKAVQLLYRGLKFLVDNIDRIAMLVNAFLDSVALAIKGDVAGIANKVILALRTFIVIAIDFLAKLLGLGDLGAKVRKIINALRKPVIRAMEWLLRKLKPLVMRLYRAGTAAVKKVKKAAVAAKAKVIEVIMWWKQAVSFKSKDGGSHKVFYKGAASQAHLMVASDEDRVEVFLARKQTEAKDPVQQKAIKKAESAYGKVLATEERIKKAEARKAAAQTPKGKEQANRTIKGASAELRDNLLVFSGTLGALDFAGESDLLVKTVVKPGSPKVVEANPLTYLPGDQPGSPPKEDPPGWEHAVNIDTDPATGKRRSNWVRGHLLNENLHGPGVDWNLVPITQKTNSDMKGSAEAAAKRAIATKGNVIYYRAEVKFYGGQPPVSDFPERILVNWGKLERAPGSSPPSFRPVDGSDNAYKFKQDAPPETPGDIKYNLNDVGRDALVKLTGISHRFGLLIRDEMLREARFRSYDDFEDRMNRHQAANMKDNALFQEYIGRIKAATDKGQIVY